ncbi:MAG TPA: hypothetical protein VHM72_00380 [Solirubrobacteraceae bacterium]|nr:hypothetical protein [Solirubrobacteraceae bacterium]
MQPGVGDVRFRRFDLPLAEVGVPGTPNPHEKPALEDVEVGLRGLAVDAGVSTERSGSGRAQPTERR